MCKRKRMKKYASEHKEQELARSNAYYKANQERLDNERKKRRLKNIETEKAKADARRKPEQVKAHNSVKHAVAKGDLPRVKTCTCADCGVQAEEYHHPDYSKPLWVVPLCKACHVRRHKKGETVVASPLAQDG